MNIEAMVKGAETLSKKLRDARIDYYRYVQNVFVEILKELGLDGDVVTINNAVKGRIIVQPQYSSTYKPVKVEFHKYKKDGNLSEVSTTVGITGSYDVQEYDIKNFISRATTAFTKLQATGE